VSSHQWSLRHLDLTGCSRVTDATLVSLAVADRARWPVPQADTAEIENVPPPCSPSDCCSSKINLGNSKPDLSDPSSAWSNNHCSNDTAVYDCNTNPLNDFLNIDYNSQLEEDETCCTRRSLTPTYPISHSSEYTQSGSQCCAGSRGSENVARTHDCCSNTHSPDADVNQQLTSGTCCDNSADLCSSWDTRPADLPSPHHDPGPLEVINRCDITSRQTSNSDYTGDPADNLKGGD